MADSNILEKADIGLKTALQAWELEGEAANPDAGISISLRYEGDLAAIEALGFETHMVSTDSAMGVVRFKDLPALAAHPGVLWMAAGQKLRPDLDTAAREIKARATAPVTGAPVDGLWHVATSGGALTNTANATGEEVIVAVIDTGIDYTHPMFMSQLTPTKVTRILKIWDQGLTPTDISECPNKDRFGSANTYGVEYDSTEINAAINGGAALLHRDCHGHGTHVAGIAAGGPLFPAGGNAELVGIAPKASIIAVKLLDVPDHIYSWLPANTAGPEIFWINRFKDAVLYCLRSARTDFGNKPIVINMSFGGNHKPGDGLDDEAVWVDGLMDPTRPVDPLDHDHFPTRAIIVKSAGNDGNPADNKTAHIVVPASGEITVPLMLEEIGSSHTDWRQCSQRPYKPTVGVHFWFRPPTAVLAVQFSFRVPNEPTFSAPVSGGGRLELGFVPRVGPPPSVTSVVPASFVHRASLTGDTPAAVPHPGGAGSVRRHYMKFFVTPKEVLSDALYHPGIYEVRIVAPAGTEVYAMCELKFWNSDRFVFFSIATTMQNGDPLPPGITITNESSATDTSGRHVITVASYDDLSGDIAASSSRGPLRNFSDPASPLPVIAAKPDLAAPGVVINSAKSIETELPPRLSRTAAYNSGVGRFWEMGGTSMAAPMIAGVIALMLDKNQNLNVTQVRTALLAITRSAVNPSTPPASTQAYGAGRVDAMTSHSNTP